MPALALSPAFSSLLSTIQGPNVQRPHSPTQKHTHTHEQHWPTTATTPCVNPSRAQDANYANFDIFI